MSSYIKSTDFAAKDALVSGNPGKIISGVALGTEFDAIESAVNSKADLSGPALTGTTTAVNLTVSGTFSATVDGGAY